MQGEERRREVEVDAQRRLVHEQRVSDSYQAPLEYSDAIVSIKDLVDRIALRVHREELSDLNRVYRSDLVSAGRHAETC